MEKRFFKNMEIPPHEQRNDIEECCDSVYNRTKGTCPCFCKECLFSHVDDPGNGWKDNTELFNQWVALGRPAEVRGE